MYEGGEGVGVGFHFVLINLQRIILGKYTFPNTKCSKGGVEGGSGSISNFNIISSTEKG